VRWPATPTRLSVGFGGIFHFARHGQDRLGRRIALIFIRAIGHHSLGLAYALISTEVFWNNDPVYRAPRGGLSSRLQELSEAYESSGPNRRAWVPS